MWGCHWLSLSRRRAQDVVAVDLDPRKVAAIKAGESYIEDIPPERLQAVLPEIAATSHYQPLARTDAVLICVPTPLTANREPDLGALIGAGRALGQVLQHGQLVVLESTTYPGTTRERLVPLLEEESDLRVGDGLQRRLLARARRSGANRLHAAQHPQGNRRDDAAMRRSRRRAVRGDLRPHRPRVRPPRQRR